MNVTRCPNGHMYLAKKGSVCPYCNMAPQQEPVPQPAPAPGTGRPGRYTNLDKTQSIDRGDPRPGPSEPESEIEPVVGWLVCVDGKNRGQDYRIKSEKNLIGRSEEADIRIEDDNTVSRKQAIITYEPRKREFFLIPKDEGRLVYVNDNVLHEHVKLAPYDLIQLGNSTFVFVPFCGAHFEWKNDDQRDDD